MLLPNLYVLPLPALSSQLSVLSKLCIMNTLLHFLLLRYQSCRSLRNVSFGGCILGLINSACHGWLSMMTSSHGPLFSLASALPTLNPPLPVRPLLTRLIHISRVIGQFIVRLKSFSKCELSIRLDLKFNVLYKSIASKNFNPI